MKPFSWIYGSPMRAFFVVFAIDYGAMSAIRLLFEPRFYLTKWYSFRIGDFILLPLYAALAAYALQKIDTTNRYSKRFWYVWCLGFLALGIIAPQLLGFAKLRFDKGPSETYHAVLFWFMFPLITYPWPLLVKSPAKKQVIAAFACIIAFLFLVLYDRVWNTELDDNPWYN